MTSESLLSKFGVLSHDALLASATPQSLSWLVEGFMPSDAYCILSGESKSGKSALATHLSYCVATGEPFLGMPVQRSAVLWLTYEESASERAYLCDKYPSAPVYTAFRPGKIDTREGLEAIRDLIGAIEEEGGIRVGLVVVDPLIGAVESDSMSEPVKARRAMDGLNDLRRALGVSVLVLHHNRKAGGRKGDQNKMADSHQIQASVSQWWVMEVAKRGGRTITLHGGGRGDHANRTWRVESKSTWSYRLIDEEVETVGEGSPRERFLAILSESGKPMPTADIARLAGINRGTAQNLATKLEGEGKIKPDGKVTKPNGKQGRASLWVLVG